MIKEDGRLVPGRPSPGSSTDSVRPFDRMKARYAGKPIAFDMETRGSDRLWKDESGTHAKLASFVTADDESPSLTVPGPELRVGDEGHTLPQLLFWAGHLIGHNIMNYDLLVLARHYGFPTPWELLAGGKALWDTQLVESLLDPPEARWSEGEAQRHYKLDAVAHRRGFPAGKVLDLAERARREKHKQLKLDPTYSGSGFELIPWDDEHQNIDLLEYARQDAALVWDLVVNQRRRIKAQRSWKPVTKKVRVEVKPQHFDWKPKTSIHDLPVLSQDYILREHKVAAIASQIMLNGFRVDIELVAERVAAGQARRAEILEELRGKYGLPTKTADGKKDAKSPQSTRAGKKAIKTALLDAGVSEDMLPAKERSGDPDLSKERMQAIIEGEINDQATLLAETVMELNGIRSLYGQIQEHLAGDRVHPNISMRQASGRWSFTKPGLTVVGKRKGRVVEREVFIADEGHVILTADLSQVDARAVAALSQDEAYMELFAEGRDLWTEMSQRFGISRDLVKVLGHGANYSMGPKGAAKHNPTIPYGDILRFYRERDEQFPKLALWQQEVRDLAAMEIPLDNGFGRLLNVNKERAYTQAPALSGQSAARDIMMEGMLNLCTNYPEALPWLRALIHDEVVMSVPQDMAQDMKEALEKSLTFPWAPHWGGRPVQIKAAATIGGRDWASAYAGD